MGGLGPDGRPAMPGAVGGLGGVSIVGNGRKIGCGGGAVFTGAETTGSLYAGGESGGRIWDSLAGSAASSAAFSPTEPPLLLLAVLYSLRSEPCLRRCSIVRGVFGGGGGGTV